MGRCGSEKGKGRSESEEGGDVPAFLLYLLPPEEALGFRPPLEKDSASMSICVFIRTSLS